MWRSAGLRIGWCDVAWTSDFPHYLAAPPEPGEDWEAWAGELTRWLDKLASSVGRRNENLDQVINGRIELPTPFVAEHSGNVRMTYVGVTVGAGDFTTDLPVENPAIIVNPKFGDDKPKGVAIHVIDHPGFAPPLVLNQICGTHHENPVVAGYSTVDVTGVREVTPPVAVASGWSGNGVLPGDEILLYDTSGSFVYDGNWRTIAAIDTTAVPEKITVSSDIDLPVGTSAFYVIRRLTGSAASIRFFAPDDPPYTPGITSVLLAFY